MMLELFDFFATTISFLLLCSYLHRFIVVAIQIVPAEEKTNICSEIKRQKV